MKIKKKETDNNEKEIFFFYLKNLKIFSNFKKFKKI